MQPTSPKPWELVPGNEHHGPYITTAFGSTICDFYAMSNPSNLSVRNGGDSKPIQFVDADGNAELTVRAVNSFDALLSSVREMHGYLAAQGATIMEYANISAEAHAATLARAEAALRAAGDTSLPDILSNDGLRFWTDRWGDIIEHATPPVTEEERAIVEAMLPMMQDEITFIGARGDRPGIIFEVEYSDGNTPGAGDKQRMDGAAAMIPQAAFYFVQGESTYNDRVVARAFLPTHHAEPETAAAIATAMFAIVG